MPAHFRVAGKGVTAESDAFAGMRAVVLSGRDSDARERMVLAIKRLGGVVQASIIAPPKGHNEFGGAGTAIETSGSKKKEVEKLGKKIKEVNVLNKKLRKKDEELQGIREIYMEAKITSKNELHQKSVQLSKAEAEIEERTKQWQAEKVNLQRQIHNAAAAKQKSDEARKFKQQVRPGYIKCSAHVMFMGVQRLFAVTLLPL